MKHQLALLLIAAVFVCFAQQASAQDVAPKPATAAPQPDSAFAALEGIKTTIPYTSSTPAGHGGSSTS